MRRSVLFLLAGSSAALGVACVDQGDGEGDDLRGPSPAVAGDVPLPGPPELSVGESAVAQFGQLRIEGTQVVNAAGNPVQLKGVSTMWLNWEDRYAENKDGLRWMRDNWGLTVIRAAMGIEPDNAFLTSPAQAEAQVRRVVQNAIDLGVYVIIDWHDHNAHLHQEQAIQFFTAMATDYGGYPNVIYETYNEPRPRDSNQAMVTWATHIRPYHEAVVAAVRAIDPDNIVVLGNPEWDQRPDIAARNPVSGTNLMYAVHFYSCDHRAAIRRFAETAYNAGVALFATEWGATDADGGTNGVTCVPEAQAWHDWMDQRNISWTAWKLDGCRDSSCFFANDDAPAEGNWPAEMLSGHAPFVIERMLD